MDPSVMAAGMCEYEFTDVLNAMINIGPTAGEEAAGGIGPAAT